MSLDFWDQERLWQESNSRFKKETSWSRWRCNRFFKI